mmetsp:Transcript_46431/g.132022  ORF Transcript_46431/g.132022 Transcript_46431/m.132022 type:complete len:259 (-) Transcript_46431:948-1724(-)
MAVFSSRRISPTFSLLATSSKSASAALSKATAAFSSASFTLASQRSLRFRKSFCSISNFSAASTLVSSMEISLAFSSSASSFCSTASPVFSSSRRRRSSSALHLANFFHTLRNLPSNFESVPCTTRGSSSSSSSSAEGRFRLLPFDDVSTPAALEVVAAFNVFSSSSEDLSWSFLYSASFFSAFFNFDSKDSVRWRAFSACFARERAVSSSSFSSSMASTMPSAAAAGAAAPSAIRFRDRRTFSTATLEPLDKMLARR